MHVCAHTYGGQSSTSDVFRSIVFVCVFMRMCVCMCTFMWALGIQILNTGICHVKTMLLPISPASADPGICHLFEFKIILGKLECGSIRL